MIQSIDHVTYIVSIVGYEKADFPYYISKLLDTYGKNVLVLDNTKYGDTYFSLNNPEENKLEPIQVGGITFARNIAWSHKFFSEYDYVLVLHGERISEEYLPKSMSDFIYVVTDYDAKHIRFLKDYFSNREEEETQEEVEVKLILLDKISEKISNKTILTTLCTNTSLKIVSEEIKTVTTDETDRKMYQALTYNGSQKLKPLSVEYKEVLTSVFMELTGIDNKKLCKQYLAKS